jgi:hypothetical protein
MDPEIRAEFQETHRRIDAATVEMRRHFDSAVEEMRSQAVETRRHFDVVAEGLRADIRLVAGGVVSLSERVDRVEENLRQEIRLTRSDLTALITVSYRDLDRRVRRLEGGEED